MKIKSIEPTPNPNSMKITLDECLPQGIHKTFSQSEIANAPRFIQDILKISGVKSVFHAMDFLAIERSPKQGWESILTQIKAIFDSALPSQLHSYENDPYGSAKVFVQMISGIPMQVKVLTETADDRFSLPDRFTIRASQAASASADFLKERQWIPQGIRYGVSQEIGEEVVSELSAKYDDATLDRLLSQALNQTAAVTESVEFGNYTPTEPDPAKRYAALEQMEPSAEILPLLIQAMQDTSQSVRRLATAYMGSIEDDEVVPHLIKALKDQSVAVRRTAGDALSDRGEQEAIPVMTEALKDPSKIVRWRAARFLYEVGDKSVLSALREALDDPEFEVRLQVKLAIERIESGSETIVPAWQKHMKDLIGDEEK
ncbi:virulence factor [Effusibacillus consociatus]|uniref:Virulence factor n=1 Tax=Effusibacillus consociatus TaxID=1117041 RepID=A0ABV9PY15_9BACL